jgi:hypothetical protein
MRLNTKAAMLKLVATLDSMLSNFLYDRPDGGY